jgi:hypothetical protein
MSLTARWDETGSVVAIEELKRGKASSELGGQERWECSGTIERCPDLAESDKTEALTMKEDKPEEDEDEGDEPRAAPGGNEPGRC